MQQYRRFYYPDLMKRLKSPPTILFDPIVSPESTMHIEHGDLPDLSLGDAYEIWQQKLAKWLKRYIDGEILFFILDSIVQKYFGEPEESGEELRAEARDIVFRMNSLAEEADYHGYEGTMEKFWNSSTFYSRVSSVITDLAVYKTISKGFPAAGFNVRISVSNSRQFLASLIVFVNGIDLVEPHEFREFAIELAMADPKAQYFVSHWLNIEPYAQILHVPMGEDGYVASKEVLDEILAIIKEITRRAAFRK